MKEFIILIIKGFVIGLGKIIPGVSGAMLAISLGVYERGLEIISNLLNNLKNNLKFIIPVGLGFIISVLLFSKIIVNLLNNCYLPTMLLFVGLIYGSISKMHKSINWNNKINFLYFIFTLLLSVSLSFIKGNNVSEYNFYIIIFMGFIEAISMIVPGLSGTALLMAFGYYEMIINALSIIEIKILFPFILGIILGAVIISRIIKYFFMHYHEKTNVIIYGLATSSIIILLMDTFKRNYSIYEIFLSLFFLIVGYNITKIIEK